MEPGAVKPLEQAEEAALSVETAEGAADVVEPAADAVEETTEEIGEPVSDVAEDGTETVAEPAADEAPPAEDEEPGEEAEPAPMELSDVELKALLQAVIYITDEPLESRQMAQALQQPIERVDAALAVLVEEFSRPESGLQIREIAGGFKMATKPEHHEAVRQFVKNLKPSFKLTPAALETLAVIAYKQPITAPEIMEIRGVQGAGVLKTLVERKLITTAGRMSRNTSPQTVSARSASCISTT